MAPITLRNALDEALDLLVRIKLCDSGQVHMSPGAYGEIERVIQNIQEARSNDDAPKKPAGNLSEIDPKGQAQDHLPPRDTEVVTRQSRYQARSANKPFRAYKTCTGNVWERIDGEWFLNGEPRGPGLLRVLFFLGRIVDHEWPLW